MSESEPVTVYYWGPTPDINFYGRGIGIYLTLNKAGIKWEVKPPNARPENSSMAPPAVVIDGTVMGQTPYILITLGEKYGLCGKNPTEKMTVLQALGDMEDVFVEVKAGKWDPSGEDSAKRGKAWLTYLDKKLVDRKWMGGTEEPTVADFHGVFSFEWVVKLVSKDLGEYPNVEKWWKEIKAYSTVADMYASCVDGRKMIP